jgi:hypothetical protein
VLGAVGASAVIVTLITAPAAHATHRGSPGVIVFGAFGQDQADLWSAAPDGSGLTNLTPNSPDSLDICPAVSADGRRVASCRNAGGGFEIWTSDIGGGNDRQVTHLGGGPRSRTGAPRATASCSPGLPPRTT